LESKYFTDKQFRYYRNVGGDTLFNSSTAGTTSGNVHNYNGKIGFFELRITRFNNSSSFKTTGKTGIL
jgi:hypothetical protein